MQSTASSVLQTSFLIIGGDSKLGGLKVVERKPDPQTALSLFSAHNRLRKQSGQNWPPQYSSTTLELHTFLLWFKARTHRKKLLYGTNLADGWKQSQVGAQAVRGVLNTLSDYKYRPKLHRHLKEDFVWYCLQRNCICLGALTMVLAFPFSYAP